MWRHAATAALASVKSPSGPGSFEREHRRPADAPPVHVVDEFLGAEDVPVAIASKMDVDVGARAIRQPRRAGDRGLELRQRGEIDPALGQQRRRFAEQPHPRSSPGPSNPAMRATSSPGTRVGRPAS